ncbi:MAG: epoxyqueuosine reductase [Oscillospiraceae bacterium]|nr:epoxyqueuosine reductase [Oscillospiraceae bacterium]
MDREHILKATAAFSEDSPTNYLSPPAGADAEKSFTANNFSKNNMPFGGDVSALDRDKSERYVGMRFFMPPIMAVGRADDPKFAELKNENAVGPHHRLPEDWLPGAKSVISLFLPYSERVIKSNTADPAEPSYEWLFTRVDGQQHLLAMGKLVCALLEQAGYRAVVPQTEDSYCMRTSVEQQLPIPVWSSNWSERHVAYVTGLGTFGRMTNIITKKGCCGRLISIVTDWEAEPDERDYEGLYDYCCDCGKCYSDCPAGALSPHGKDKTLCAPFLRAIGKKYAPRYGCGKCQSGLPCSTTYFGKNKKEN